MWNLHIIGWCTQQRNCVHSRWSRRTPPPGSACPRLKTHKKADVVRLVHGDHLLWVDVAAEDAGGAVDGAVDEQDDHTTDGLSIVPRTM
jgi:hypothetical protein